MSSRPMCNVCDERVTMGSCACGENAFGALTKEQKQKRDDLIKRDKK